MAQIQLLDQDTINKIAAGEVIERPASVVKELMENSIDAGATAVTVEIRDGGISMIRVTDNGSGIEADQIRTAFLRHSTSKIRSAEDLMTVTSLGFRGEALASIAAVARVELITKTADKLTGIRYCIEGGEEKSFEEVGAPAGTTFIVRDLFFNTPVRRNFLKSTQTEASYIIDLVEKIALSHPEVSVHLIAAGQTKLHTAGTGVSRDDIRSVFGREVNKELLPIEISSESLGLTGFIGRPTLSRGNRSYEIIFINGRYIRSDLITRALEDAYHGFVMQHRYPFAVLYFDIPSEYLDVNVHPTKMELRFTNEEDIYNTIYTAVRDALSGRDLMPRFEADEIFRTDHSEAAVTAETRSEAVPADDTAGASAYAPGQEDDAYEPLRTSEDVPAYSEYGAAAAGEPSAVPEQETEPQERPVRPPEPFEVRRLSEETEAAAEVPAEQLELFDDRILAASERDSIKFLGIVFDTYFLVEYKDEFLMIDQHAAHEKVLYERLMKAFSERTMTCQQLNPPIILTLNARETQVLTANMEAFTSMGFEIEPFGGREYAVYGVPDNIPMIAREDLLMEMLDDLADDNYKGGSRLISERIATMSCKAAVKGGMKLSIPESEALIEEMLSLDNPYNCPHGRPTTIAMSRYEIEKKFKRIV